ncbi:hypothetical protein NL520_27050, partial [Klebsiella pneumoniae]|nr:hypothetical protein [Klebsiella pneumoniae]
LSRNLLIFMIFPFIRKSKVECAHLLVGIDQISRLLLAIAKSVGQFRTQNGPDRNIIVASGAGFTSRPPAHRASGQRERSRSNIMKKALIASAGLALLASLSAQAETLRIGVVL